MLRFPNLLFKLRVLDRHLVHPMKVKIIQAMTRKEDEALAGRRNGKTKGVSSGL